MQIVRYQPESHSPSVTTRMRRALLIASNSQGRQQHGALLMQGARTLAVGINSPRNSGSCPGAWPNRTSVHAEVAATKLHAAIPNTTLYVARLAKNGSFASSEVCPRCVEWLTWHTNVKVVIHS